MSRTWETLTFRRLGEQKYLQLETLVNEAKAALNIGEQKDRLASQLSYWWGKCHLSPKIPCAEADSEIRL